MKKVVMGLLAVSAVATAFAASPKLNTQTDKVSYAMGYETGKAFQMHQVSADVPAFAAGMTAGLHNTTPAMTDAQMQATLQQFQKENQAKFMASQQQAATANAAAGTAFLAKNKTAPGVVTLPSGLQYKIVTAGTGPMPKLTDKVTVDYEGSLINGTVFDSSYKRGQPATFGVNQVIPGWTQALQLMPVGSTWELYIPASLAYGERGAGAAIGPNQTLVFKVHLISIAS